MYWALQEYGRNHVIMRANMDGGHPVVAVNLICLTGWCYNNYGPHTVGLDVEANRLYWLRYTDYKIEYTDLDKADNVVHTLLEHTSYLASSSGLAIDSKYIYWTDKRIDAVFRVDKDTGQNVVVLVSNLRSPRGVDVYRRNEVIPGNLDIFPQIISLKWVGSIILKEFYILFYLGKK